MIGPEHLRTVLEDAIPVPPERLTRAPLRAIRRRIRRRRAAMATVAVGVVVVAVASATWLVAPLGGSAVPPVGPSSRPSPGPSPDRTGPVAPPTTAAGVALAWRTAIVDAAGTTVTLGLDIPLSAPQTCRTVTATRTGGDASEIVLTAYQRIRPGRCDDPEGAVATVKLSSALGGRALIDGSDGTSRPSLQLRDIPVLAGVGRLVTTPDTNEGWTASYSRGGFDLTFHAVPAQDSPPLPEGEHLTVPGHTLILSKDYGYSADWVEAGWRITFTAEASEGTTITHDELVPLLEGLPWR
jgi:hypothetical protein